MKKGRGNTAMKTVSNVKTRITTKKAVKQTSTSTEIFPSAIDENTDDNYSIDDNYRRFINAFSFNNAL